MEVLQTSALPLGYGAAESRNSQVTTGSARVGVRVTRLQGLPASVPRARRRLVDEQPVQAELFGRLGEFHEVDWLAHVAVGAEAVTVDDVALLVGGGENHNRQQSCALVRANALQHLQPVDLGQLQIEQDDSRQLRRRSAPLRAEEVDEGLYAVLRHDDFVRDVVGLERPHREGDIVGVILYEQNLSGVHTVSRSTSGPS